MFSYNIFRQNSDILLAICDKGILGRTFRGSDIGGGIEITVSEFYKGKTCGAREALKLANSATIINATGNKIIKLFIEKNIVEGSAVLKIGSVTHAQIVSAK